MTQRGDRSDDDGLSLVELIVYIFMASLLLLATTAILINSWTTQRNVTNVTDATNRGQVMTSTIERAVRNAVDLYQSPDGTTLLVRTSLSGNLECQGFFVSAGQSKMKLSTGALGDPATWVQWQPGIAQRGSTPFFAPNGQGVVYTFDISTTAAPVRFGGQAVPRVPLSGPSAPCWS